MTTRPSTQPAVPDATSPSNSMLGRAPTRVASGAVPPAQVPTYPGSPAPPTPHSPTERIERASRVGTHLRGAEGLSPPGSEAPKLRLTQGKVIPGTRYKIIRWVGEGGMGVVYEAEHVDIERRVALKILRFDLSQQPKMVKVFKDEAKAAGRLGSQYLVDLYDFGELRDGRLFFAMELLDGSDLVPPDAQYSMDPGTLVPILRQSCKGLGVAHSAGVVHRDVKPENIITTTSIDGRQQVKIVDFGISSMLAAGRDGAGVAGTPHYMAPEQITSQPFDGRLDIYSLGCTAYELLTGEPPFDANAVEALLEKHISDQPLRPSQRRPDKQIPAPLEDVIMRCLEKRPEDRYRDTADLEAAICEAQIAAGIRTEWDDMPLPELPHNPERAAQIARLMPSPHRTDGKKRGWLWPVVAAGSTLAAVGLGLFLAFGRGPTDSEVDDIERLTAEARDAASRANWVVPPPDDTEAATAFIKVLSLEELEGSAESLGDERGEDLRGEFATTLIKHADELWDHGAGDLARHYYFQALVFDDSNSYAFDRAGATPSLLAGYIDRAKKREFNDADRILASLAAVEMEQDPTAKQERLDAVAAAIEGDASSDIVLASSEASRKLLGRRRGKRAPDPAPEVDRPSVVPPAPDPPEDPIEDDEPEVVADDGTDATPTRRARRQRRKTADPTVLLGNAERDPERAAELADKGVAALRAGRRGEASSLFNQAISHDRKNAKALMGLSDVYFDTGKNQKAVEYAEKAVRASPANRSYRLKLGDAYFKVLRYKDALEQYEQAKKRGSTKADARIAKVKAKLGN